MVRQKKQGLITDLDNTLFDCVDLWTKCFTAMLDRIVEISGIPAAILKPQIKRIHQKHGTSEYTFLIEELPLLQEAHPQADLMKIYAPVVEEFRKQRRAYLQLYPTVAETLLKIKGSGARIIGYTESMAFYSNYRIRRLGLDGVFDIIFCPEDHSLPATLTEDQIKVYPAQHYRLEYTRTRSIPSGSKKPNVQVLESIIFDQNLSRTQCVYVGDSLFKDVAMAQAARITDVWAKYGETKQGLEYNLLREVSHWTAEDVLREAETSASDVKPGCVLECSFSELLDHFEFGDAESN
jgi:phosphoglycolate phosphatase-like HAD superfamily hydrolase